jgi:hypothetical protein
MGVQRLLPGAEGVEQVQGRLPFHPFVVSLQQELQRNGDLPGRLEQGVGHETPPKKTAAEPPWWAGHRVLPPWPRSGALVQAPATLLTSWSVSAC